MSTRVAHLLEEFAEAAQAAHGLVGAGRVARSSKKIARQPVNAANCRRLVADMTETPAAHAPATPRDPPPSADACLRRWPGRMLSPHLPPSPAGEAQPQRQPPPARRHDPSPLYQLGCAGLPSDRQSSHAQEANNSLAELNSCMRGLQQAAQGQKRRAATESGAEAD